MKNQKEKERRDGSQWNVRGAYHRHMTGRLWWCRPLARGSRSTWQFVTAPRFCSCCSSGAMPPLRRCLFVHDAVLEKWQERNNQKGFHPVAILITLIYRTRLPGSHWVPQVCLSWISIACSVFLSSTKWPGTAGYQFSVKETFFAEHSILHSLYFFFKEPKYSGVEHWFSFPFIWSFSWSESWITQIYLPTRWDSLTSLSCSTASFC